MRGVLAEVACNPVTGRHPPNAIVTVRKAIVSGRAAGALSASAAARSSFPAHRL